MKAIALILLFHLSSLAQMDLSTILTDRSRRKPGLNVQLPRLIKYCDTATPGRRNIVCVPLDYDTRIPVELRTDYRNTSTKYQTYLKMVESHDDARPTVLLHESTTPPPLHQKWIIQDSFYRYNCHSFSFGELLPSLNIPLAWISLRESVETLLSWLNHIETYDIAEINAPNEWFDAKVDSGELQQRDLIMFINRKLINPYSHSALISTYNEKTMVIDKPGEYPLMAKSLKTLLELEYPDTEQIMVFRLP